MDKNIIKVNRYFFSIVRSDDLSMFNKKIILNCHTIQNCHFKDILKQIWLLIYKIIYIYIYIYIYIQQS